MRRGMLAARGRAAAALRRRLRARRFDVAADACSRCVEEAPTSSSARAWPPGASVGRRQPLRRRIVGRALRRALPARAVASRPRDLYCGFKLWRGRGGRGRVRAHAPRRLGLRRRGARHGPRAGLPARARPASSGPTARARGCRCRGCSCRPCASCCAPGRTSAARRAPAPARRREPGAEPRVEQPDLRRLRLVRARSLLALCALRLRAAGRPAPARLDQGRRTSSGGRRLPRRSTRCSTSTGCASRATTCSSATSTTSRPARARSCTPALLLAGLLHDARARVDRVATWCGSPSRWSALWAGARRLVRAGSLPRRAPAPRGGRGSRCCSPRPIAALVGWTGIGGRRATFHFDFLSGELTAATTSGATCSRRSRSGSCRSACWPTSRGAHGVGGRRRAWWSPGCSPGRGRRFLLVVLGAEALRWRRRPGRARPSARRGGGRGHRGAARLLPGPLADGRRLAAGRRGQRLRLLALVGHRARPAHPGLARAHRAAPGRRVRAAGAAGVAARRARWSTSSPSGPSRPTRCRASTLPLVVLAVLGVAGRLRGAAAGRLVGRRC